MQRGFFTPASSSPPLQPPPLPAQPQLARSLADSSRVRPPPVASLFPPSLRSFRYSSSPDGTDANLLILFHGRGDTAEAYARFAEKLNLPQTAVLALDGTLTVPFLDRGRSWFTAFESDGELIEAVVGEKRRSASLAATVDAVCQVVAALVSLGWTHRCFHLFGFSDGGMVALEVALRHTGSVALGSCVSVCGGLLPETLDASRACAAPPHTPILITSGETDALMPALLLERTRELLLQAAPGCASVESIAGKGHAMVSSPKEARILMQFWSHALRHTPVTADGETLHEVV